VLCLLPASYWFLAWIVPRPWRWRQYVTLKRVNFSGLHSVIYQKMEPFITTASRTLNPTYYGESVNRLQMDIKRKKCDIRSRKEHLFLNISSTNIGTLVPSLYQCVETCSSEVFWLLYQSLPHLRFNFFVISETFATKVVFGGPNNRNSLGAKSGL
jgi:hypothetical protein